MELPKRSPCISDVNYSRIVARNNVPTGACQHFQRIRMKVKPGKNGRVAQFNMKEPCSGKLEDVVNLGVRLAEEALEREDSELATKIYNRIKVVIMQYQVAGLMRKLKREEEKIETILRKVG